MTYYLLAFWGAALVCFTLTPVVRRLAIARGVLDRPDPRKIHLGAVPRWGGAAVWLAVALAIAAVFVASPTLRSVLSGSAPRWGALAVGCCAILAAGMVDDARGATGGLPAWLKLGIEIAAAALVVFAAPYPHALALGPQTTPHEIGPLGALFGVLWIVTLTNAVNMTDVVDGVAGGLGAIAAVSLGLVGLALGRVIAPLVLLGLGGALLGFLPHNFRRQRIFLGDSGSLVIGFLLGAASLVGLTQDGVWLLLPAVLALGLPLAECGITVLRRTARAVTVERPNPDHFALKSDSPRLFTPDARHIPHRLLGLGLSQRGALAVLYGSAIVLGALAWISVRSPWTGFWGGVLAAAVLAFAATRWWYEELRLIDRGALLPLFDNGFVHRRVTHAAFDAACAALALLASVGLTDNLPTAAGQVWLRAAVVVGATLLGLRLGGIYRASYLHAGLSEAITAGRSALAGAALAWVAWLLLFGSVWPTAGWLLYAYVLLTLIVGGRMLSRLLLHAHERATSGGGPRRVLIYGAGRAGRQALGAMLGNPALGFLPLGFVDDDVGLTGAEVQGYPVHGGNGEVEQILERLAPSHLVFAAPGAPAARRDDLASACARRGVRLVSFGVHWHGADTPPAPLA